jgi:hypothetical protein
VFLQFDDKTIRVLETRDIKTTGEIHVDGFDSFIRIRSNFSQISERHFFLNIRRNLQNKGNQVIFSPLCQIIAHV